jgi:hypothetical protein
MRKLAVALIFCAALTLGSSPSWALLYTLSAPVAFSGSGATGTLNPVASGTGTTLCLSGTCGTDVSHDWLVFTVSVTTGFLDEVGISRGLPSVSVIGVGTFSSDPDVAPQSGSISPATLGRFNYGAASVNAALNLDAGETSDRLFGAFTLGDLPGPGQVLPFPVPPGTISFMLSAATDFTATGIAVLVPEPSTLLLLGGGLFGLGLAGRRRSR